MCIRDSSGEAVKLFAVKKAPGLSEEDLRGYMIGKLASYKMPKHIEFRDELPKTNVGKILRRALRDGAKSCPHWSSAVRRGIRYVLASCSSRACRSCTRAGPPRSGPALFSPRTA